MLAIAVLCLAVTLTYGLPVELVPHKSTEFDHYVFTQNYPPGVCYLDSAQGRGYDCFYPRNASSWTIHGLWPTEGTTEGPNYCKNVTFYSDAIQSLVPQLVAEWTNLENNTGFYSLWEHEYVKHGSCTGLEEYEFFSESLKLFGSVGSFGDALRDGGIVPSKQTTYDADTVRGVLNKAFSVTPSLVCEESKGNYVLHAMELCLTKDNFSPMVCPDREKVDNCYDSVLYPPSMYSVR